jgi:hypothetical protein
MPRNTKATAKDVTTTGKKTKTEPQSPSRMGKSQANKLLSRVPEENVFWCHDGQVLRDMKELRDALTLMSDETFSYHSNAFKKDFSAWVKDIVGDEKLAKDMETADTRQLAVRTVEARCDILIKKSGAE